MIVRPNCGDTRPPLRVPAPPAEDTPRWLTDTGTFALDDTAERPAVPVVTLPRPGTSVGKYRIVARLGGVPRPVFRAIHGHFNAAVAVRFFPHVGRRRNAAALSQFKQEVGQIARVGHPHVVRVLDLDDEAETPFLVTEYIDGPSLAELLRSAGRPSASRAVRLIGQLADALSAVHAEGLTHRHVKPANVILAKDGTPRLADLGLGPAAPPAGESAEWSPYLAPELAVGGRRVDRRADVYGLGVTLYEMLTGHPPYDAPKRWGAMIRHFEARPVPAHLRCPTVGPELSGVIARMMAVEPAARYATCPQAVRALVAAA